MAECVPVRLPLAAIGQVEHGGFEREGEGGPAGANQGRHFSQGQRSELRGVQALAQGGNGPSKTGAVVGAEARERRGLAHADDHRVVGMSEVQIPGHVFGQGPARGADALPALA